MRVFLSWSGTKSREVALALKSWLPEIINDLQPWMSSEDIEKGAAWSATIAEQLEQSNFGIICLTRENQDRVWVNYEAGAIAKAMFGGDPKGRAATFLIDIEQESEVTGPLAQFQHTRPTGSDVLKLVTSLNKAAGSPRTPEQLERAVAKWWPDLESAIAEANSRPQTQTRKPVRSEREVLEEILTLVRDIASDASIYRRRASLPLPAVGGATEEFLAQLTSIIDPVDMKSIESLQIDGNQVTINMTKRLPSAASNRLQHMADSMGLEIAYARVGTSTDGNAEYEGRHS